MISCTGIRSPARAGPAALAPPGGRRAAPARAALVVARASPTPPPPIMVNSCTGRMGLAAAEAVVRAGLELVPLSLAGAADAARLGTVDVSGTTVSLAPPESRDEALAEARDRHPGLVVIDYTLPMTVNDNALAYIGAGVPFVMGTTGGDRAKLQRDLEAADHPSVIAPNMGKQIVALQTAIANWAAEFPGSCAGYRLDVVESHQKEKADTSGTCLALVDSFKGLGVVGADGGEFDGHRDIRLVRDREGQLGEMGVPESALSGHAFHTYTLTSPDGTVVLSFQHNVVGRRVYAEGTVDAALFLAAKVAEGSTKKLYNMVDVLKAGAMR